MKSIKLSCCALGVAALLVSSGAFAASPPVAFSCPGAVNFSDWVDGGVSVSANDVKNQSLGSTTKQGGQISLTCSDIQGQKLIIAQLSNGTAGSVLHTLDLASAQMPSDCFGKGHIYMQVMPSSNVNVDFFNNVAADGTNYQIGGCY